MMPARAPVGVKKAPRLEPITAENRAAVVSAPAPEALGNEDIPKVEEKEEDDPFDDIFKIFNSKRD